MIHLYPLILKVVHISDLGGFIGEVKNLGCQFRTRLFEKTALKCMLDKIN